MSDLLLRVVLGEKQNYGTRWASIVIGDDTVFSTIVYDNHDAPAEQNIVRLFASRLRRILEDDE